MYHTPSYCMHHLYYCIIFISMYDCTFMQSVNVINQSINKNVIMTDTVLLYIVTWFSITR